MEEFLTEIVSMLNLSLFPLQFRRSDLCCWNLFSKQSLSSMYCKLQELQGIEYMPASFFIPLVGNFIAQILFRGVTRTVY